MKKKLLCAALAAAMLLSFAAACSSGTSANSSAPENSSSVSENSSAPENPGSDATFELVLATSITDQDPSMIAMAEAADEIKEASGGRLTMTIYPSSSLIPADDEPTATRTGEIDIFMGYGGLISDVSPWATVVDAPYVIENYDHLCAVMDGEIGQTWMDRVLEENGLRCLGSMYFGTRNLNLTDIGREVRTPEDMKGVLLRVPNTEIFMATGYGLGASPVPMALSEVYLSLSTGAIQGQENPLAATYTNKFYEVTKYIVMTKHVVSIYVPMMNEEKFQALGPELQEILLTAVEHACERNDELVLQSEADLVQTFADEGLTIIDDPDIAAFKENMTNYYFENTELAKSWDMDIYNQIGELAPSNLS